MEHVGKHYEKGEGEEQEDEELRQWASREGKVYHAGKGLWRLKDLKEDHTHDKNKVALDDEEDDWGNDSDTNNYHPFRKGRPLLDPPQPKHATDWKTASRNLKQVRVRKVKSPLISENMPSKRDPVSSQSIEDAASRRTHRTMDSYNLRRPLIPTMAEHDGIEHEHQEEHSFDADLGSDKRTRAYSNPPVRPANQRATPGRAQLGRTRDISGRMSLADHAHEQLLNTLMTEFHRWISFIWSHGFYNCANQQGNESSERTVSSRPAPSFAAPRRNAQRTKCRKLPQDNDGEENGDEGRDDGDSSPAEAMPSQPVRKRKWACPFHKRNPSIFSSNATTRSKYRSCAGPGFDTIARLKEHLYRRHKPEKRCPRCWTEVKDNVALREHLNQDSRCAEREAPDIECLNDHMIQKLQSKKRSRGDAKDSEAEKWREIYVLIFHNTRGQIPSPFYDESMALDQPEKQPRSAEIGPDPEFQDYFQTNLSIMVEEGLKAIISEMFEPVDHKVSTSMPELVRTSIATVLKNWQSFQHRGASRLVDSHNGGSNTSGETRADVDSLSQPENEQNLDWDFIFEQFPLFSEDVPGLPNFGEDIF